MAIIGNIPYFQTNPHIPSSQVFLRSYLGGSKVGNAAEHLTAVTVATKDKMDLSLGVALGSSTQIALFVVPFTVIVGWYLGVPMDLNFRSLDVSILLLTVLSLGSKCGVFGCFFFGMQFAKWVASL